MAVSPFLVKTVEEVGLFFDMSPRTVERWFTSGCPGRPSRYDLRKIARWLAALRMKKLIGDQSSEGGESSPALEAKRRIEVELRQLDLEERRGSLVSREGVEKCLAEWASVMRTAYEQVGRLFGPEAQDLVEQAVSDATSAAMKFMPDEERD